MRAALAPLLQESRRSPCAPSLPGGDYTMDHSAMLFLLDTPGAPGGGVHPAVHGRGQADARTCARVRRGGAEPEPRC